MLNKFKTDFYTIVYLLLEYIIATIIFTVLIVIIDFTIKYISNKEFIFNSNTIFSIFFTYFIADLVITKYKDTKRLVKENE